jgi:hypothetical protein
MKSRALLMKAGMCFARWAQPSPCEGATETVVKRLAGTSIIEET